MTTLEMEIKLMLHFNYVKNIIVPNVSWGMNGLHECDLLVLSQAGYATEVEIKISKSDLLKDKLKPHGHEHPYIKTLYFAVPEKLKLLALKEIPERAGLLVWTPYNTDQFDEGIPRFRFVGVRKPITRKDAQKFSDKERMQLLRLGSLRIIGLKKNILKLKNHGK